MAPNSIKRQLIAIVVLSQTLLALGLLFAGTFYTRKRLVAALDSRMQAHAMSVAALARYSEDEPNKLYFDKALVAATIDPDHDDFFTIWSDQSGLLTRSDNWPKSLEPASNGAVHWVSTIAGLRYRGLRLANLPVLDREPDTKAPEERLTIVYLSPMLPVQRQVRDTGIFIAAASLVLLAVTVMLALWGISQGLLPLQQLAAQAELVSTRHWELQLPSDAENLAELKPLVRSMQTMLGRLQRSFIQQREFVGNAAHELKTPVAVLKSTLQSLLQIPRTSEEYRAGLEQSLEDMQRLEQLLQWMLRLARAEQWAHGSLRPDLPVIDVTATCEEAVERLHHLTEARHMTIQLAKNGSLTARADPEDLQTVWANLLENAVRYSPEHSTVEMSVTGSNGSARIVVADHGPGIPAADLPRIFERFHRGDPSRTRATGGFGLGLSIAKALVEAYGGTITAESVVGEGTRMTVELPTQTRN